MSLLVVLPILLAPCQEKPQRPYEIETIYVIHKNVTAKNYKRIEALFAKAYPKVDLAKLKPAEKDLREYYSLYWDRPLGKAPGTDPKLIDHEQGFKLVRDQIDRELRVRVMFWWFREEAIKKGSLKAVFDHLVKKDDSKQPVLSTKSGKALVVYRHVVGTARQLEDLKDGDVRFGRAFSNTVRRARLRALPSVGDRPGTLGHGQGRFVLCLLKLHDPVPGSK